MTRSFVARQRCQTRQSAGFTLVELLIVVAVIGTLAAIAVPGILNARMTAGEAAAIGSLKAINTAQASYYSSGGRGGYAVRLATLASPCPSSTQAFLSPDLSTDPAFKSGYRVTLQAATAAVAVSSDCNGVQTHSGFYTTASPLALGVSGRQAFASGTAVVIFADRSGTPPTEAAMLPGGGAEPIR